MEAAFAATGAFNDKLQRRWLLGLRRWARVGVDGNGR